MTLPPLRSTAYGWLEWFESLPEGVQAGILEFMDTQVPAVAPKATAPKEASQSGNAAQVAQPA